MAQRRRDRKAPNPEGRAYEGSEGSEGERTVASGREGIARKAETLGGIGEVLRTPG